MLQIAIVEQDQWIQNTIIEQCKKYITDYFTQFKIFQTYDEMLTDTSDLTSTNILISNINYENEIEKVNSLKQIAKTMQVIFYSNQLEIAPLLYDANPIYFICQNQLKFNLRKALQRFLDFFEHCEKKKIAISYNSKIQVIDICDILYIERFNRKIRICTKKEEFTCYIHFDQLCDILKPFDFIRTHISYLVQIDSIASYNNEYMTLKNNDLIPISRSYRKELKQRFKQK